MKKHKATIFLLISLSALALLAISVIVDMILEYYQIQSDFANDVRMANDLTASLVVVAVFFIIPIFAVGFSCIRSVYKILRYEPSGIVKMCYLLSAIISFLAFILQLFWLIGLVDFKTGIKEIVLFLTEWPIFIISFLLGSISIKHRDWYNNRIVLPHWWFFIFNAVFLFVRYPNCKKIKKF